MAHQLGESMGTVSEVLKGIAEEDFELYIQKRY